MGFFLVYHICRYLDPLKLKVQITLELQITFYWLIDRINLVQQRLHWKKSHWWIQKELWIINNAQNNRKILQNLLFELLDEIVHEAHDYWVDIIYILVFLLCFSSSFFGYFQVNLRGQNTKFEQFFIIRLLSLKNQDCLLQAIIYFGSPHPIVNLLSFSLIK
jgi:hypothetical protein